jgi:hypothetical protein
MKELDSVILLKLVCMNESEFVSSNKDEALETDYESLYWCAGGTGQYWP